MSDIEKNGKIEVFKNETINIKWIIDDAINIMNKKIDDQQILSPLFIDGECELTWRICFFPSGTDRSSDPQLYICMHKRNCLDDATPFFDEEFTVLNKNEVVIQKAIINYLSCLFCVFANLMVLHSQKIPRTQLVGNIKP